MSPETQDSLHHTKVYFLANPDKPDARAALDELTEFARCRCDVVGSELNLNASKAVAAQADYIVVLGGDGTLIGVARDLGENQVPLIGINVGKLGFLAEFSLDEFKDAFDRILTDPTLVRRRTMLDVCIRHNGTICSRNVAVNDCVIHAGAPFRSITLGVNISGTHLTDLTGDGLIVCTPTGSTAHSLSAGGPILQPGIDAIVLTPLCPHSLTHKPLVIERHSVVQVTADRVNEGSTALIDGQVSCPLMEGDRVVIQRFGTDMLRVRHPRRPRWHNLVSKLHWGRGPTYVE